MKTNGNNTLRIGMTVIYCGGFGSLPPKPAVVKAIDLCEDEHEKYGEEVEEVAVQDIRRCCLILDDNHWCYGYQIEEIVG